jgi:hypothetical protein
LTKNCKGIEQPKQETLEEAAEKTRQESFICCSLSKSVDYVTVGEREKVAFINGAKWQEKRMYSEEEVLRLLIYCKTKFGGSGLEDYVHDDEVKEWFESIKKK